MFESFDSESDVEPLVSKSKSFLVSCLVTSGCLNNCIAS